MSESKKAGPKEILLHIFGVAMLYWSVGNFIALMFGFINLAFPDSLTFEYGRVAAAGSMRWAIASLIVSFPLYLASLWYLHKQYKENPRIKSLKSRTWLVYLTMFAAALLVVGDFIALIFRLLEGDLTVHFLLKSLVLLFVAIGVFIYYLWELKRYGTE